MSLLLILKFLVVLVFLVMFLRRPQPTWGIGLLTVTTAVLLDTFLGTFGRDQILSDLGFFFYVVTGVLFGGAAVWTWGVFFPLTRSAATSITTASPAPISIGSDESLSASTEARPEEVLDQPATVFDRQMIYEDIRDRFGREDILDLIFDMGINETQVMTLDQDMNQLIINVMDLATQRNQTGALALAVERILTPLPASHLPRLEKIGAESPPTVLRQFLLANYDMAWLQQVTFNLGHDWEQLGGGGKKEKVRNLLLYLYRRNRIDELIEQMKEGVVDQEES